MLSDDREIRECGCGLTGAAELLVYLCRCRGIHNELIPEELFSDSIPPEIYDGFMKRLRRYIPIVPPFGATGVGLAVGVNLLFRRCGLKLRAYWKMSSKDLFSDIEDMLKRDIPVIMSAGPNFPFFWHKEAVDLYMPRRDGGFEKSASIHSHYVIVTGTDGERLRISSWGREFFVSIPEYRDYVRRHSNYIVSNILYVKETT